MKKLLKLTKMKALSLFALFAFILPLATLAANPVLDSVNLYQIANTANSTTWGTTAQADPGETLTFMVHVHNNVVDSTATGVRVKATLPTGEVTQGSSTATVSANNATAVSSTVNFTLSELAHLEYIPGSTVLYNHNGQAVQTLPDGIVGSGIDVTNKLQGCWEYELWVKFQVKVVKGEVSKLCKIVARVYEDANRNGIRDAGEALLQGWTVNLSTRGSQITDSNGRVIFTGLVPGMYTASEDLMSGWINTTPLSLSVSCTPEVDGYVEFGNVRPSEEEPPPVIPPEEAPPVLPSSGPVEAAAGIIGSLGLGSAGYLYQKSRSRLKNSFKKF